MAQPTRPLSSAMRQLSLGGSSQPPSGQSSILQTRINEKKAELENLKQLKDLSAALADQMQALEEKLSTLSNGTEAVAAVLSNWHDVLRAINMASQKIPVPTAAQEDGESAKEEGLPLPQTLVRIPAQATNPDSSSRDQDASAR
ncbi:hypothetical protein MMC25_002062 [Agyrium rufum]|nr:hypothetical protein [Agyrium rufum]